MIHCTPVAESERSSWIVGIAIATIVWSMKVIETAKIIAARISLLFCAPDWFMPAPLPRGRRFLPGFGYSRRRMPQVFWLGFGIAAAFVLIGAVSGARSRTASLGSGAAMGAYLGVMSAFPLIAIGLATA